jgi:ribosomal protein L7/L12
VVVDPGAELIPLVRELRDGTDLSLREATELLKRPNAVVKAGMKLPEAEALQKRLEAAGAQVRVSPHATGDQDVPRRGA